MAPCRDQSNGLAICPRCSCFTKELESYPGCQIRGTLRDLTPLFGLLFWLGQASVLTILLCVGIKLFRVGAMAGVRIQKPPPEEACCVREIWGAAIPDSPVNSNPSSILLDLILRLSGKRNGSNQAVVNCLVWRNQGIVQPIALGVLVNDNWIPHPILWLRRIEQVSFTKVIFDIGGANAEVSKRDPKSERNRGIAKQLRYTASKWVLLTEIDNRSPFCSVDAFNQKEGTVDVQRRFRRLMQIASSAYQLPVEPRDQSSSNSGDDGRNRDYERRIVVAMVLVICGCIIAIWGVREIGRADWRWLGVGLLTAESGGFVWLDGWPWNWARRQQIIEASVIVVGVALVLALLRRCYRAYRKGNTDCDEARKEFH